MDKQTLRIKIKARRLALSAAEIETAARAFMQNLQAFFKNHPAQKIGIYLAGKGELDLKPSIDWLWQQQHQLYAPVLAKAHLVFHEWTPKTQYRKNQFGLTEPINSPMITTDQLDYVLVPLVAFTRHGHRLGMGKGYYDRTFAFGHNNTKPVLIGCAYAFQEVPDLPTESHDIPLEIILTPVANIAPCKNA